MKRLFLFLMVIALLPATAQESDSDMQTYIDNYVVSGLPNKVSGDTINSALSKIIAAKLHEDSVGSKIFKAPMSITTPTTGDVVYYNGSNWIANQQSISDYNLSLGAGLTFTAGSGTDRLLTGAATIGIASGYYLPDQDVSNGSSPTFDVVNSSVWWDVTTTDVYDGPTKTYTAGAGGIAQFDLVYISGDKTVLKCDRDAVSTGICIGMALENVSASDPVVIGVNECIIYNASWSWTAPDVLYTSSTPGEITTTVPATSGTGMKVAEVIDSDRIQIKLGSFVEF